MGSEMCIRDRVPTVSDRILLGINNRNLNTFETSLSVTKDILASNKELLTELNLAVVSESGIFTPQDIDELSRCGASGYLIGEALMKDPELLERLIVDFSEGVDPSSEEQESNDEKETLNDNQTR